MALYDAQTGQIVWSMLPGVDVGRGMAADIDPRHPGYEFWGAASVGLVDGEGQRIADAPSSVNHAVWWDADLLREIEDSNWITQVGLEHELAGPAADRDRRRLEQRHQGQRGADRRPLRRLARGSDLARRPTTPRCASTRRRFRPTNRIYTLMHDPQYRLGIAWQNVAYNQPPHPGFFLGEGMADPPRPRIVHRDTQPPAFKTLTAVGDDALAAEPSHGAGLAERRRSSISSMPRRRRGSSACRATSRSTATTMGIRRRTGRSRDR